MTKKNLKKIIIISFLCIILILNQNNTFFANSENLSVESYIKDTFEYYKNNKDYIIDNNFLDNATSSSNDWIAMSLGRYAYQDNQKDYKIISYQKITEKYQTENKLDKNKASEWHRISLTLNALGDTSTNVNGINLIADGTFEREVSPGKQGINGWIWGLITLDSKCYKTPENSTYTRLDFIENILKNQNKDGGFSLFGDTSDVDITAMAITALSPYYQIPNKFTINNQDKTIYQIINECINFLSANQLNSGDFKSWGSVNCESTAQVLIALCSLNINPLEDERFIKNGNNLLNGLLKYKLDNGAFAIH